MQRAAARCLLDLGLATKTIGHYELFRRHGAQMGPQPVFIDLHREIVFVRFETEASRHAAATVIEDFRLRAHGLEKLLFGIQADDRFLVTVSVNHDVFMQARRLDNFAALETRPA